jgi:chromosome segregation ATPase
MRNPVKTIQTANETPDATPIQTIMAPAATDSTAGQLQLETLELKNKLLDKENRIIDLENELAAARLKTPVITSPVTSTGDVLQEENNDLKRQLDEALNKTSNLQNQLTALKRENNQLAVQLSQANGTATASASGAEALKNRNTELERRILEQNLALSFMQVDCNLARVDAQQVISNARQRKELLLQTLGILNGLAISPDAAIRKKVKEKTAQLHKLAGAIRD